MFDKEKYKETLRKFMTDWTEQQLDDQANFMEKKHSTVKTGEGVVHLDYSGIIIEEADVSAVEEILSNAKLELSRYDKDGIPFASLDGLMLDIALILNEKTTQEILLGLGTGAAWDAIKSSTYYLWNTVKNWSSSRNTQANKRSISFGVKMSLDKNTKLEFHLNGDITEQTVLTALDKMIDALKDFQPEESVPTDNVMAYSPDNENWIPVDMNAAIKAMAIKSKKKEK